MHTNPIWETTSFVAENVHKGGSSALICDADFVAPDAGICNNGDEVIVQ
jgi:hypothetical protein